MFDRSVGGLAYTCVEYLEEPTSTWGVHMNDSYISKNGLMVVVTWIAVAASMFGAWAFALAHPDSWVVAAVLAATGCVLTGVAVVAHMRCYSARLCALVRVTAGLEAPDDAQVTRLR